MHLGFEGLSMGFGVLSKFRVSREAVNPKKNEFNRRRELPMVKDRVPFFFQILGLILESPRHQMGSTISLFSCLFPGRGYSNFGLFGFLFFPCVLPGCFSESGVWCESGPETSQTHQKGSSK